MDGHVVAKGRHRWSVAVVALVVPAAALLTAGASTSIGYSSPKTESMAPCCVELVADPAALGLPPSSARYHVSLQEPEPMVVTARAVNSVFRHALPVGVAPENGLQVKTILAARTISAVFPEIQNIGGVRPDSLRWHPNGLALDVMIPDYHSAAGKELGDRIVAFALHNADRFGLEHVIFRQTLYPRSGSPYLMGDYGSDDANHYTHVHIATDGGGYPTGIETYFI